MSTESARISLWQARNQGAGSLCSRREVNEAMRLANYEGDITTARSLEAVLDTRPSWPVDGYGDRLTRWDRHPLVVSN